MGIPIPYLSGGVSFIQKELKKSYPQISHVKKVIQKSYPIKILSKLIPLYIKQNYAMPLFIKQITQRHFISNTSKDFYFTNTQISKHLFRHLSQPTHLNRFTRLNLNLTVTRPVLDPLAVLSLDNRLYVTTIKRCFYNIG